MKNILTCLTDDLRALFDEGMHRLGVCGASMEAKAVFHTLSWAKEPLPLETLAEASFNGFGSPKDTIQSWQIKLKKITDQSMQFIAEKNNTGGIAVYSLYDEKLREYLHNNVNLASDCQNALQRFTDYLFEWKSLQGFSRIYALNYLSEHLYQLRDVKRIWILLKDDNFRNSQFLEFNQCHQILEGLKYGILLYSEENQKETTPEYISRLAWLVLKYGKYGEKSKPSVSDAWQLAWEGKMEEALRVLNFADKKYFFKAAIYLIWIEADRMRAIFGELDNYSKLPEEKTRIFTYNVKMVLDELDKKASFRNIEINWYDLVSVDFMAFWLEKVMIIPQIDIMRIFLCDHEFHVFNDDDLEKEMISHYHYEIDYFMIDNLRRLSQEYYEFKSAEAFISVVNLLKGNKQYKLALELVYQKMLHSFSSNENGLIFRAFMETADVPLSFERCDYEKVYHIADCMIPDPLQKTLAVLEIAKASGEKRYYEHAIQLNEGLEAEWKQAIVLHKISKAIGEKKIYEQILTLVDRIENKRLKKFVVNEIAKSDDTGVEIKKVEVSQRAIDAEDAEQHYKQMLEKESSLKYLDKKAYAFLEIAIALKDIAHYEEAVSVVKKIDNHAVKEKIYVLLAIANCTGDKKHYNHVLELSRKIDDLWLKDHILFSTSNSMAINQLFEPAVEIANKIDNALMKAEELFYISKYLAENNQCEQAIQIADSIDSAGDKTNAFLVIAKVSKEKQHFDRALKIFKSIEIAEDKVDEFMEIAENTGQIQDYENALLAAKNEDDTREKLNEFLDIAKIKGDSHHYENALKASNSIFDPYRKDFIIDYIIETLANNEQYEEALQIAGSYCDKYQSSFIIIVASLAKNEKYERAIQIVETLNYHFQKDDAFLSITKILLENKRYEQAIQLANRIDDLEKKSQAFLEIAKHTGDKHHFEQTVQLVDMIDTEWKKAKFFLEIAELTGETQYYERAVQGFKTIKDVDSFLNLISFLRESNQHYEQVLQAIKNIKFETLTSSDDDDFFTSQKVSKFIKFADFTGDSRYLERAIQIASDDSFSYRKNLLLNSIVKYLSKMKRDEEALKLANSIDDEKENIKAYLRIAEEKGDIRLYEDILKRISNIYVQSDKFEILKELVESIQKTEIFTIFLQWYKIEHKNLAQETRNYIFDETVYRIQKVLQFPENLQMLLQWVQFMPPSLVPSYRWFIGLNLSLIKSQKVEYIEYVNSIFKVCCD